MSKPPNFEQQTLPQGIPRAVDDYIASMTDSYIEQACLRRGVISVVRGST